VFSKLIFRFPLVVSLRCLFFNCCPRCEPRRHFRSVFTVRGVWTNGSVPRRYFLCILGASPPRPVLLTEQVSLTGDPPQFLDSFLSSAQWSLTLFFFPPSLLPRSPNFVTWKRPPLSLTLYVGLHPPGSPVPRSLDVFCSFSRRPNSGFSIRVSSAQLWLSASPTTSNPSSTLPPVS